MDKRRTTLAAFSPSQLNSRTSLGPSRLKDGKSLAKLSLLGSRPSLIGAKPQGNNAPSRLAQAGGPRRSSQYGKSSSGVKPDPRPVNDKAFQANCARCLIGYLSTHGYDQPISPKLLASPMSKDFTNIVHFLMRQVDPHLSQKSLGKIEDDVPAFFKRLRYPFQISKSSLFAVGSPHTWPSLLASLVWIVELLIYGEKAEKTKAGVEDERQKAENDFFEYVAQSYRCFLAGDDHKCEQVDKTKAAEFEERASEIRSHNSKLQEVEFATHTNETSSYNKNQWRSQRGDGAAERHLLADVQENERLKSQIEDLRSNPSPLMTAKARLATCTADHDKYKKVMENLQSSKQSLQLKIRERQSDLNSKAEQLNQAEQECKELQERISAQTFNRDDVIRMNDERNKREDILQSATSAREGLQRRISEQEVTAEQRLHELDIKLREYNTAADRLQLIPVTAKRAGGVQFEAKLNRAGTTTTEVVNVDFKGAVKAALNRVREGAVARGRQLVEEGLALQERMDSLSHSLTERTEENATLTIQVRKLAKQLTRSKEERESEIRSIQAEAEQLKAEVSEMKNATSHSIAHSSGRIRGLQNQYEETTKACEMDRTLFNQELASALHSVYEHKEATSSTLQRVHSHVAEMAAEICAMKA